MLFNFNNFDNNISLSREVKVKQFSSKNSRTASNQVCKET